MLDSTMGFMAVENEKVRLDFAVLVRVCTYWCVL